jgi:hypothetical protein
MPCYDERAHDPKYICQSVRERAEKAEAKLANEEKRSAWLTAALCLMTHPDVTSAATPDFGKYLRAIPDAVASESGISMADLLAWKAEHDAADIKRRALEKLTPAERKALGH